MSQGLVGCDFLCKDTATTEIYTLSLHDALPIYVPWLTDRKWAHIRVKGQAFGDVPLNVEMKLEVWDSDRKSTRLNSSHANISYAVFCLQKKPLYPRF